MSFDWTSTGIYTALLTTYFIVFIKFFLKFYRVYTTTLQILTMAKVEGSGNVTFEVLLFAYNVAREEDEDSNQTSYINHNGLEGPEEL